MILSNNIIHLLTCLTFALLITLSSLILTPTSVQAAEASLNFSSSSLIIPNNSTFSTSIVVDTSGYPAGGVGAIIHFDPSILLATAISTSDLFADYPITSINNDQGVIVISGIAASADHLYIGKGTFATISFLSQYPGSTTLTFAHQEGSTIDSNIAVTFGNGDVLSKVGSLRIDITSRTLSSPDSDNNLLTLLQDFSFNNIKQSIITAITPLKIPFLQNKYASVRDGRSTSQELSPLDPIVSQAPITDPLTSQPKTSINTISSNSPLDDPFLPAIIFLTLSATLLIYLIFFKKF